MSINTRFSEANRIRDTILVTVGWLGLSLCWMAFAWGRYSFLQAMAGLGIATFSFSAIVAVRLACHQDLALTGTMLSTLAGMSFTLYWVAFAASQYALLQNSLVLALSVFVWGAVMVVTWLLRASTSCP
jgi:hypothetical protein